MKLFFCALAAAIMISSLAGLAGCGMAESGSRNNLARGTDRTFPEQGANTLHSEQSPNAAYPGQGANVAYPGQDTSLTLSGQGTIAASPGPYMNSASVPGADAKNMLSPGAFPVWPGIPGSDKSTPQSGNDMLQNLPQFDTEQTGHSLQPEDLARSIAGNVRIEKQAVGGMTGAMLLARIEEIAAKTDIAPVDAGFDLNTWAIKRDKAGKKLDVDKVVREALKARKGQRIPYSYKSVKPKVTTAQMKGQIRRIAKFSTPFLDRSRSRIKNIRLASSKLDGTVLLPGQEFSFNGVTGSKSKKFGYEDATVIVRTPKGPKHKKAPGGGVCQVSTTLYNAVLQCRMKVTERHEHSDDVYYVPDGKDATVTYRGADFRFINNRSYPVMIRVSVGRTFLQVRIYENSALNW